MRVAPFLLVRASRFLLSGHLLWFRGSIVPSQFHGCAASGFHDNSFIMKCDADICKGLFTDVVPSGGTTIFQEIGERVKRGWRA